MYKLEIREGRTDRQGAVDETGRLALFQMAQMPGYRVLLDLMETECLAAEAKLVNTDPADDKAVLAEHKIAKASWLFFIKVQQRIAFEIAEIFKPEQEELTAEQKEILSILDATRNPVEPPSRDVDQS